MGNWNSAWVLLGNPDAEIPSTLRSLADRIGTAIDQNRQEAARNAAEVLAKVKPTGGDS